jgi:cyclopropane-fatty-acyl-phospholipid synthase
MAGDVSACPLDLSVSNADEMNVQTPHRGRHFVTRRPGLWARLVANVFHRLLDRIDLGLEAGAIEVVLPDGTHRVLGGRAAGPIAQVNVNRWNALLRLVRSGSIGCYEGWEAGDWDSTDPVPLFDLFVRNRTALGDIGRASGVSRAAKRVAHWLRRNSRKGASRNIHAHYDLGNDFYKVWLDRTMSYSSALFAEPLNGEETLEAAQKRKCSAMGKRLKLKPNSDILEIGCGWGFFSKLCGEKGHNVTAITLSPSQKLWAENKVAASARRPDYRICDYRDVTGQYDAIASIEMVEAVGQRYWPDYVDVIARSLRPGGRAAMQYIAIADDIFEGYAAGVDFIQHYIFPGGMLLSESRFRALAEARGLSWEDAHHFPLHYAETLRRWRVRLDDAVEAGKLPEGFDEKFVRLWRFYLQYCEGGFRGGGITVAQVTMVKRS